MTRILLVSGTRIVYDRTFLMNLKNSPVARTPPTNLSSFPSELLQGSGKSPSRSPPKAMPPPAQPTGRAEPTIEEGSEQFEMDI